MSVSRSQMSFTSGREGSALRSSYLVLSDGMGWSGEAAFDKTIHASQTSGGIRLHTSDLRLPDINRRDHRITPYGRQWHRQAMQMARAPLTHSYCPEVQSSIRAGGSITLRISALLTTGTVSAGRRQRIQVWYSEDIGWIYCCG
jgi:hypothetical protein